MGSIVPELRSRLKENESIDEEMKRLRDQLKALRLEKEENENFILDEWDERQVPEIVERGVVFRKKEKPKRKPKPKSDKIQCLIACLEDYNIILPDNAERLAQDLLDCIRGDPVQEFVVQKDKKKGGKKQRE